MSRLRPLSSWGVLVLLALPAGAAEPSDPRLWLEDVTGDKALAWVKERNAASTAAPPSCLSRWHHAEPTRSASDSCGCRALAQSHRCSAAW